MSSTGFIIPETVVGGVTITGADPGFFFRRGYTRLLLYFNTNKPHSLFIYQLYQETAGHLRGGAHPLHPPSRSASVLGATTGAGLLCKTALRGGQFDKNEFIKEMNLTDDKVVDFAPLITRFEKQCNETFLTA